MDGLLNQLKQFVNFIFLNLISFFSFLKDKLNPLSNVQISIDGKPCCQTDSNGLFKLKHIRPTGTIKIKGELDGYTFKEVTHTINLDRLIGIGDSSTSLVLSPEK
jgi:hypothetical protein